MKEFDPIAYKQMVKEHQENDKPTDWCDSIYQDAQGDYKAVFWADLEPNPYLINWLKNNPNNKKEKTAIVIGCGVGDDAEALASYGYTVTAFDIAPTAIKLCKNRYPDTKVDYLVADLFNYPKQWFRKYDLVYECNTIQILAGKYRVQARESISSLLTKEGHALVSCRSRNKDEKENEIPKPLDKEEIDEFKNSDNLEEVSFLVYMDTQTPPVEHFFAVYKK